LNLPVRVGPGVGIIQADSWQPKADSKGQAVRGRNLRMVPRDASQTRTAPGVEQASRPRYVAGWRVVVTEHDLRPGPRLAIELYFQAVETICRIDRFKQEVEIAVMAFEQILSKTIAVPGARWMCFIVLSSYEIDLKL
jgi:hypothetical protein